MQIVFAGKAHPADDGGKRVLQNVYRRAIDPLFGGRVAFVDDYDLHVAHFLVQGCDVWLNNAAQADRSERHERHEGVDERQPSTSASATAGGPRATPGPTAMLIDPGVELDDADAMDAADADALYRLLEEQIVPSFYERDEQGVPRRWIGMVKDAIRTVAPRFCTRRMVKEYVERMYQPAMLVGRPGEGLRPSLDGLGNIERCLDGLLPTLVAPSAAPRK